MYFEDTSDKQHNKTNIKSKLVYLLQYNHQM